MKTATWKPPINADRRARSATWAVFSSTLLRLFSILLHCFSKLRCLMSSSRHSFSNSKWSASSRCHSLCNSVCLVSATAEILCRPMLTACSFEGKIVRCIKLLKKTFSYRQHFRGRREEAGTEARGRPDPVSKTRISRPERGMHRI